MSKTSKNVLALLKINSTNNEKFELLTSLKYSTYCYLSKGPYTMKTNLHFLLVK